MIQIISPKQIPAIRNLLRLSQNDLGQVLGISRVAYANKEKTGRFWVDEAEKITVVFLEKAEKAGLDIAKF